MPAKIPIRLDLHPLGFWKITRSRPASQSLCLRCALTLRPLSLSHSLLRKGGGKQDQKRTLEVNAAKTASNDDAHDFSDFKTEIDKAVNYLKSELSKLKAGGLDLEAIEALKVNFGTSKGDAGTGSKDVKGRGKDSGKARGEVVSVGDIAQIAPKGRVVIVMAGEKDVGSQVDISKLEQSISTTVTRYGWLTVILMAW